MTNSFKDAPTPHAAVVALGKMTVNEMSRAMKGGIDCAVSIAALIVADDHLNGANALGKRTLLSSIKQSMANRGEKPGSFATYSRIGQSLIAYHRSTILHSILTLEVDGRNAPVTGREVFDAVRSALGKVPGLMGSFTELKAATIGGVATTKADKAAAKIRALFTGISKLDNQEALFQLAKLATARFVLLDGQDARGGVEHAKLKADTDALLASILTAYAPTGVAIDEDEEEEAIA